MLSDCRKNYKLSHLTWFKVGGAAELFFKPNDITELLNFLKSNDNRYAITILGAGSNVIIRDAGVEGVVVKLGRNFNQIEIINHQYLRVGAGCLNFNLAKFCLENSLTGLEFIYGIPGTIGGGVFMNAGAYGKEFKDIIVEIETVNHQGEIIIFKQQDIDFKYRSSNLPDNLIITSAVLRIEKGNASDISNKMQQIASARSITQPIKERTGGSTFANPEGHKAWRLIDAAGMRGYKLGGASVSKLHCNFLINDGSASAGDLENLGNLIYDKVLSSSGVSLHWEIKRIGKIKH